MNSLLEAALRYAERGWAVIPTGKSKRPFVKSWGWCQLNRPSAAILHKWFNRVGVTGLAVVLGPVSGNLVCRDFDTPESYDRWKSAHPDLAALLPTVRTGRGYHVYFRNATINKTHHIKDAAGNRTGELRGKGYCLLPPSEHPDGGRYTWLVALDGEVPEVADMEASGFTMGNVCNALQDVAVTCPSPKLTQSVMCVDGVFDECEGATQWWHNTVDEAIARTLPTAEGQRHHALWQFLLCLKAMPAYADSTVPPRELVERWHRAALPTIRTKALSATWTEAQTAWPRIRPGVHTGSLRRAWERAVWATLTMSKATLTEWRIQALACLCRELQQAWGDRPFPLPCKIGCLLGVSRETAANYLQRLTRSGVLRRVSRGDFARAGQARKAAEYRYVWSDEDNSRQHQARPAASSGRLDAKQGETHE